MNGWRLATIVVLAFVAGGVVASWVALIRNETTRVRLYRRALANTDHSVCCEYIAEQEWLLDEAGKGAGDEAEAWLEAEGS